MIRFLDTISLGQVAIGKSIFQSFEISHFGIKYGLDRCLPTCKDESLKHEIFTIGLLSSVLFSFIFLIFWFFYEINNILFYSFFYVAGLMYCIISIYRIYYRAEKDKNLFVNLSFFSNILPPLFQIVGLYFWGKWGIGLAFLTSHIIVVFICTTFFKVKLVIERKRIYHLFKIIFGKGFLLFLASLISYFSVTADRFFIEYYWGIEQVGIFSVIMFFFTVFSIFSVNYTEMIMNKIMITKSFKYVLKQICILIGAITIIILITSIFLPFFIKIIMPQYLEYVNLMRLILWAAVPFCALSILNQFMHAIDKRKVLLVINFIVNIIYYIFLINILKDSISLEKLIYLKIFFFTLISFLIFLYANYLVKTKSQH